MLLTAPMFTFEIHNDAVDICSNIHLDLSLSTAERRHDFQCRVSRLNMNYPYKLYS